jgi:hypothetical protein
MPIARATLIAAHLAQVNWDRVYTLDTRRYAPAYLPSETANRLSWRAFVDAVPAMHRGVIGGTTLEAVIVSKSVTWSDRDVNVYIGSPAGPALRSYLDLDEDRFAAVLGWHVALARELTMELGCDVYVTHGFNPLDSSPDAHSVTSKFHTHVHVPDLVRRHRVAASMLSHFDQLTLIEPYAVVAWDIVRRSLAERGPTRWRQVAGFGFISLYSPLDQQTDDDLRVLSGLMADLHHVYLRLVEVFTAGQTERSTGYGRFVPRPPGERRQRLAAFESASASWLSGESTDVLRYLANGLTPAEPRDTPQSTRIATAEQAWIAKGLSGALNLVVPADAAVLRFDFAPRVISTSGATKVISTDPTIIRKDRGPASLADQQRMTEFHQAVVAAARVRCVPKRERGVPSTSSSQVPPASSA